MLRTNSSRARAKVSKWPCVTRSLIFEVARRPKDRENIRNRSVTEPAACAGKKEKGAGAFRHML